MVELFMTMTNNDSPVAGPFADVEVAAVQEFCARVRRCAQELAKENEMPEVIYYSLAMKRELEAMGGDVSVLKG